MKYIKELLNIFTNHINELQTSTKTTIGIVIIGIMYTLMFVLLIGAVFGVIYGFYYLITWIAFWLFGPVIFGVTMTWKTPLMVMFVAIVLRSIFSRSRSD